MKIDTDHPISLIQMIEGVSIEAQKAQHMAELEQLAKYRAQLIETYKAWSKDPEKTREMISLRTKVAGETLVKGLDAKPYEFKPWNETVRKVIKEQTHAGGSGNPPPKDHWHQKLKRYLSFGLIK